MIRKKNISILVEFTGRYDFEGLPIECFKIQYSNMTDAEFLLELVCMN